jgi:hypothetical protein
MSVKWPAWIRFSNEAELLLVADQAEWNADPDLHAWSYDAADRLVDSAGYEFAITFSGEPGTGKAVPVPTGVRLEAEQVRTALRLHSRAVGKESPDHLQRLESASDEDVPRVAAALLQEERQAG